MSNVNLFEVASRTKMRFPYKGMISVEDLWDLSLPALDGVFKTLNSNAKKSQEESLLNTKSKEDETIEMQIEIVKHIVFVKLEEKQARENALEKKEKKQKIMQILAAKEDEDLQNKSVEDLHKMLEDLE